MRHFVWRSAVAGRVWRAAGIVVALVAALAVPVAWAGVGLAQEALARITSPQPGASVREVVVVTGTALHPRFKFYKVEYAVEPGANWVVVGDIHAIQVSDGVLAQWDTRTVPDGSYSLRLSVVDETGNFIEYIVRQVVVANATAATAETGTVTGTTTTTATPATPTPTATPAGPTATVSIVLPLLQSPTLVATGTRSVVALPTAATPQPGGDQGIGGTIRNMVTGVVNEVVGALGIDFGGLGLAFWRGAVLALGVFLVIGALALVRAILVGLYRLIRR